MIPYVDYFKEEENPAGPPPEGVRNVGHWFRCKIDGEVYHYGEDAVSGGYFLRGDEMEVRGTMEVHALRHEVAGDKIP